MRCADHLREINDNRFSRLSTDKDVELVEVTMNEAGMSKSNDEIHQLRIQFSRGRQLGNLSS